ncbi:MAG: hypothetical protein ABIP12_03420 [Terriglobales bacterium]
MVPLASLWMPIVVAAVIVFVASSILHMLLTYHRSDYKKMPDEENVRSAIGTAGVTQGVYMFPHCDHKEMKSPETQEKFKNGPIGILTIMPGGMPNMGKYLGLWFLNCLLISFFTAYVVGHVLAPGAHYLAVFRVAGTVAFMAYGLGHITDSIWKAQPWSNTIKSVVDGLIYGLLTAGTFGWLWPR